MTNNELKMIIREAALRQGLKGVMELTAISPLSYERTSKVWQGSKDAKLKDVIDVADVLGLKIKFVIKGEL